MTMRNCWACLLVIALQLAAVADAAVVTAKTTTATIDSKIKQTSKNTYTIRGAQAEQLKATIYNTHNQQQQSQSESQAYSSRKQTLYNPPIVRAEDIPIADQDQKWQSLNEDVEFIPAEGVDPKLFRRFLEQEDGAAYYYQEEEEDTGSGASAKMLSIYNVESFAYGGEEYDEYQQAWRLLGFIIDCNPMVDDDYYANDNDSGDQGTEDGCARYVLWAAVSVFCDTSKIQIRCGCELKFFSHSLTLSVPYCPRSNLVRRSGIRR